MGTDIREKIMSESVYLNPVYWFSVYPLPLLPRGQIVAVIAGGLLTLSIIAVYAFLTLKKSDMHSRVKHFTRRVQLSLINIWVIYWIFVFFAWFGIRVLGSKIFLLALFAYAIGRLVYFANIWHKDVGRYCKQSK